MARQRITIVDVGAAAGVSRSTVSLVLRGDRSISEATVQRVRAAMDELGYVYNRGAASLRESQSRVLGVIIHDLTNSVFSEIAVGIDSTARANGFVQFLAHSGDDVDHQRGIISSMREHGIAGLIISPAGGTPPGDLETLRAQGVPVVQVGRSVSSSVSSVVSDNRTGVRLAVDHLIALGHRRIAFLGGRPGTETFATRADGFHSAMEENGLQHEARTVVSSAPSRTGGLVATERLLQENDGITAVCCFNDAVAIGLMDGLRRAGVAPGTDVSVIGFDDVPDAAMSVPSLTTVAIEPRRLGASAADAAIGLAAVEGAPERHVTAPVELVVRESSALARSASEL